MAEAPRSLELLLSCSICFEEFEENGDHVPRLLPCTHTLCEKCVKQLIQKNKLQCPECKAEHRVTNQTNKERSFPQNKYILTTLARKTEPNQEKAEEYGKCQKHRKELNLFCNEEGCKIPICMRCLNKDHKKHEAVEIEEKKKEELNQDLKKVEKKVELKMKKIRNMKGEVANKAEVCKTELLREKEEVIKKFDKKIKEAEKMKKEAFTDAENELDAGAGNLTLLRSLKTSETSEESLQEIQNKVEIVKEIEKNTKTLKTFYYPEYKKNQARNEALFGVVMKKELQMEPLGDITDGVIAEESLNTIMSAKYQVQSTADTGLSAAYSAQLAVIAGGSSVVVSGRGNGKDMLKELNLQTGVELDSVDLDFLPAGLAVVDLGGRKTVAVSHHFEQLIEFRDINNLQSVLHSHQVAPHVPTRLCVSSPSTLLYVDGSKDPREYHILDCSGAEPKPAQGKNIITTQLDYIYDMCAVRDGDRELLVCTTSTKLETYDIATDELVWRVKGKLDGMQEDIYPFGVTTYGRGHLFVCDVNNDCIQMFHVADGRYLGELEVETEKLGNPWYIQWNQATSSPVILHIKNNWYLISSLAKI